MLSIAGLIKRLRAIVRRALHVRQHQPLHHIHQVASALPASPSSDRYAHLQPRFLHGCRLATSVWGCRCGSCASSRTHPPSMAACSCTMACMMWRVLPLLQRLCSLAVNPDRQQASDEYVSHVMWTCRKKPRYLWSCASRVKCKHCASDAMLVTLLQRCRLLAILSLLSAGQIHQREGERQHMGAALQAAEAAQPGQQVPRCLSLCS